MNGIQLEKTIFDVHKNFIRPQNSINMRKKMNFLRNSLSVKT